MVTIFSFKFIMVWKACKTVVETVISKSNKAKGNCSYL